MDAVWVVETEGNSTQDAALWSIHRTVHGALEEREAIKVGDPLGWTQVSKWPILP